MTKTLLPSGCYDLLPPYAHQETLLETRMLALFEAFGYEQVAPPLLEFTDSLLSGRGAALSSQVVRVMDAAAHKMMGIRADLTMQIARIAATRLADAPRPLRLSYVDTVLRLRPEVTRTARQLCQAGVELIGTGSAAADAEVIRISALAVKNAGVPHFTVDLNLPTLANTLLMEDALAPEEVHEVRSAIAHKDTAALHAMKLASSDTLAALVMIAGPAESALAELRALDLPESVTPALEELAEVIALLAPLADHNITITLDPTESRGFEYHTGITFSILAPGNPSELGRGGRYRLENGEPATGATLYVDDIRWLLNPPAVEKKILIADAVNYATVTKLQQDGFVTLLALPGFGHDTEEAKRLGCTHLYNKGSITPV